MLVEFAVIAIANEVSDVIKVSAANEVCVPEEVTDFRETYSGHTGHLLVHLRPLTSDRT